jgi:NAD(P)H-nitrite reductase large subunit
LTTYYIAGKVPREKLYVTDKSFYRDRGVDLMTGKRAVGIDTEAQKVTIDDGSKVEYDNLLIATGASARKPSVPGAHLPLVRTLRTLDDAERIAELAGRGIKNVVILGAGLVSLQTAEAIYGEGMNLTFLVGSSQILSQNVDSECAEIIMRRLDARKIAINFGTDAEAIEENGSKAVVISRTGEKYDADMVIVGKGVEPNAQIARESGITVNRGVLVDEYMRTSASNVYAAGDVAEGPGLLSGERGIVATWYNACNQGRIAGMNMAGKREPFAGGLNRNITSIFGATVASVGAVKGLRNGEAEEEVVIDLPSEGIYRKLLLRNNEVQGAVLMGRTSDAGMAVSLVQKRVKLPPLNELPQKTFLNLRELYYTSINPGA